MHRRLGVLVAVLSVMAGGVGLVVSAAPASATSAMASRTDWAHDFEDSLGRPARRQ